MGIVQQQKSTGVNLKVKKFGKAKRYREILVLIIFLLFCTPQAL